MQPRLSVFSLARITIITFALLLAGCRAQDRRHAQPGVPVAAVTEKDAAHDPRPDSIDTTAGDRQSFTDDQILSMLSTTSSRAHLDSMHKLAWPDYLPQLARLLGDSEKSEYARQRAAMVLGRIGSRDARRPLIEVLAKTERPRIRIGRWSFWSCLLDALGKCIEREPDDRLLLDLRHENPHVRWLAATYLGKRKSTAAVPELIRLLDDEHRDPRLGATWALGEIQDPDGINELIAIVEKRRSGGSRVSAIEAMGKVGTPRAIEAVKTVEPDDPAYWMAKKTLSRISQSAPPEE